MKNEKIIMIIVIAVIFLISVSASYAYFTTVISGEGNDINVSAGTLTINYVDGSEVNLTNAFPGDAVNKTISVVNTGTLSATYSLYWKEVTNTITNDELKISAACTRLNTTTQEVSGTCTSIAAMSIGSVNDNLISGITIEPGYTHKYTFKIEFINSDINQNYNQGKSFSGVINLK